MAELAQLPSVGASTDPEASMLLASRAQLDGMKTFPYVMGLAKPCPKGPEFIGSDTSKRVALAPAGDPNSPEVWVSVEPTPDAATARQALQAQQDIAADCSGDYEWSVGSHSLPMVLTPGVATTSGDGGLAFASAEQNSATMTTYNYAEVFTLGVVKVQVNSLNQETPDEAKRLVEAAVQRVVTNP